MKNILCYIKTFFSLLLCCLLLLGCAREQAPSATQAPIALPTATPELQPAVGGELVLPMPRNPFISQDGTPQTPLIMNTEEMKILFSLIYDCLLRCDANNRIITGLAEKWSADDTGRIWTLQLRENVVWHDGEGLLTADDVIYTMNTIRAYGEESFYAPLLSEAVESYQKIDDRTIEITMKRPGTSWLYALTFPVLRNGDSENVHIGTGPYQISTSSETSVELSANQRWWRQTPYIQTIRFLARESNDVALDSYDAGQLNMVPTSNVSAGKHREEGVTNVLDVYTQSCELLLINHNNGILRESAVRKAIAYAIDRGEIVSNIYMNKAAITDVPVPPDSFLYDPTSKIYDFNTAQAELLLEEAGFIRTEEDGIRRRDGRALRLTLLVNESTENTYRRSAATMMAAQLANVGIEVVVETAGLSIGDEEGEYETRLQNGQFDMALAGFSVEPSGNLSPYLLRNGARNYGGYGNDLIQLYMDNAAAALEEKDMRDTHAILQQAIVQELPFITLYFRQSSLVYGADIKNVTDIRGNDVLRTTYRWYIHTT